MKLFGYSNSSLDGGWGRCSGVIVAETEEEAWNILKTQPNLDTMNIIGSDFFTSKDVEKGKLFEISLTEKQFTMIDAHCE